MTRLEALTYTGALLGNVAFLLRQHLSQVIDVGILNRLGRLVNRPLNALGLELIRSKGHVASLWPRLRLMKQLGFAPDVIFDGGAYQGTWSVEAASTFPGVQLVAIEPNPKALDALRPKFAALQPPPTIVSAALSDSEGSARLNVWGDSVVAGAGSSLLEHVQGAPRHSVKVRLTTLDRICDETGLVPDLVKLDLQGGELPALRGAQRALASAEVFVVEFGCLAAYVGRTTPRDLFDMMYEHDFCLYDVVDLLYRPYDGALTGGDFIFVKNGSSLRAHKDYR